MTCRDHEPRPGAMRHLTGLTYAWELSGERFYLDEALSIFAALIAPWQEAGAAGKTVEGLAIEELANVMRIIDENGESVWKNDEPVLDSGSAEIVAAMRADPKLRAKPQHRC